MRYAPCDGRQGRPGADSCRYASCTPSPWVKDADFGAAGTTEHDRQNLLDEGHSRLYAAVAVARDVVPELAVEKQQTVGSQFSDRSTCAAVLQVRS